MRSVEEIEVNGKRLSDILAEHKLWLTKPENHKRADLRGADLRGANLYGVDLRGADLRNANLRNANLRGADLYGANLRNANLYEADLRNANLRGVDLLGTDLRSADIRGADIDYSCWPLWCGSKGVKVDRNQFAQLAAHLCAVDVDDDECKAAQQYLLGIAKTSHHADDLGL